MKQLNNKGFTLIELLATIAIIGLVIGLSTFGIIKIVENSKNKAKDISMDSIKSSARIYSEEASSSDWKNITNEDYKYFCVTIQELINKGLLKEKEIKNLDITKTNYVAVMKNKLTETVEKEEIISSDINNNLFKICTGSIVNEQVKTRPILNESTNYTDEIDIPFVPAKFSDESIDENGNKVTPKITGKECYYGATSSNLTTEGQIKDNSNICKIDSENGGLENNNTYYVKVCTITKKGSRICSNAKSYTSANFKKPTITINNNVTITYYDDNIKSGAGHYFKSTLDGTSTSEVQKCDNSFNCEESSTTSITKDTWYKTNDSSVTLTYQNSGDGRVTARITDRSGNSKETQKYISIYKVTFNKGTADKIDGITTNVSKLCVAETGKTCTIKSPTIEKANYTVIGWNTNSSAKTSSWNVGVEKNISNNSTYYPILRINKVYIRFNTNGGTVTPETTTAKGNIYKWKTDSNGLISRTNANGSTYSSDFFSINYGSETGSDGLTNYNNSKYLKITKTGYSAVSGSEWICQSGCTTSGKTFSQTSVYSASDFCDASNGDCTVVLGVNWRINKVYIKLKPNGGTNASTNTNYGVNENGYITYKGSDIIHTINYGEKMTTDGLLNYNSSSYLNIKKTGYNAVFEKEWICSSGCVSGRTFNQAYQYSASYFCDASTKDCTVELKVNWIPTISINLSTDKTYCSGKTLTLTCGAGTATIVDNGSTTTGNLKTSQNLNTTRSGNISTTVTCKDSSGNTNSKTYYFKVAAKTYKCTKSYDKCPSGYSEYSGGSYNCRKLTSTTNATCSKKCSSIKSSTTCNNYSKCEWYNYMTALSGTSFCGPKGYSSAAAAAAAGDACASYSCSSGSLKGTKCYKYSYANYNSCDGGCTLTGRTSCPSGYSSSFEGNCTT